MPLPAIPARGDVEAVTRNGDRCSSLGGHDAWQLPAALLERLTKVRIEGSVPPGDRSSPYFCKALIVFSSRGNAMLGELPLFHA